MLTLKLVDVLISDLIGEFTSSALVQHVYHDAKCMSGDNVAALFKGNVFVDVPLLINGH